MSRFLGPIHHWLFNKIVLFEDLEREIIVRSESKLGIDKNELMEATIEFPKAIESRNLEEIIDTDNIHGWLQEKIAIAETRQAKLITYITEKCGDEGKQLVLDIYSDLGYKWGQSSKERYDISNAPGLYKASNDFFLEGMPCDNVSSVIDAEMDLISWRITRCLHKEYWTKVNGDVSFMYELRAALLGAFIKGANDKYKYTFNMDKGMLSHRIEL